MSTRIGHGHGSRRPAGIIWRVPEIAIGTIGMLPLTAATNAPARKRPTPACFMKVPSGKNANDSPLRAALTICRASRVLHAAIKRSTNFEPPRRSRKCAIGMSRISPLMTNENRAGK